MWRNVIGVSKVEELNKKLLVFWESIFRQLLVFFVFIHSELYVSPCQLFIGCDYGEGEFM